MQRHLLALAAVLGVVLPPVSGNAQRADLRRLVIGTWELDVAKSTFRPGPPPKSWTRVYEASGENVKYTDSTVAADGKVDVSGWTVVTTARTTQLRARRTSTRKPSRLPIRSVRP